MMYNVILFDLDNTLFDFSKSEEDSLKVLHAEFYNRFVYEHFSDAFKSINTALWQRVGQPNGLKPSQVKTSRFELLNQKLVCDSEPTKVAKRYEQVLGETATWYPGVEQSIQTLRAEGYILGIITNGLHSVQSEKYDRHNLGELFDCFIISDVVGFAKPQKDIFTFGLIDLKQKRPELLNIHELKILMVGDSLESDGHGAKNMQMDFCFINPEKRCSKSTGLTITYDLASVTELPLFLLKDHSIQN